DPFPNRGPIYYPSPNSEIRTVSGASSTRTTRRPRYSLVTSTFPLLPSGAALAASEGGRTGGARQEGERAPSPAFSLGRREELRNINFTSFISWFGSSNMQVGKVSWVGQTFALSRCSDSQGKKSRSRRTKEERRKMVESFIHRYRDSNKGNFPSLNLTHKEVGGSFYTVREIVREIIQANKVLRPGNLNSQAFNLDDCPAQCLPEHDILVPQVINGDSYEQHCKSQHDSMDTSNETYSEELIELSAHGENYLPTQDVDESFAEDKDNEGENFAKCGTDDHIAFSQPLFGSSTIDTSAGKDMKVDMQANDLYKIAYSVVKRENDFEVDSLLDKLGNLSSAGHAGGPSLTHAGGIDSSHSIGSTGSGSEHISVKQVGDLDTSGVTETSISSSKNISHVPVCSDSTMHSMEDVLSSAMDNKAAISTKAQIVDIVDSPTHESTTFQVKPPLFSSGVLHTEVVGGRASGEPGLEHSISNSNTVEESNLGGTNRESSEMREKTEDTEANPLLAIIKGLVSAFIKFWTE
ncbi:hypothetical protein Taro_019920, partial [Colocasia esculenta]|nr:hypothetical protein [Colocasia esculenta]